jgi:cation transport ATPase
LIRAYNPIAEYFEKTNQMDSALYYWKKPFEFGPKEVFGSKLAASKKISAYYFKAGNNDSAAKYMNFYIMANDSVNSINKVTQLQASKLEDELRQKEVERARHEENANRNRNIQLVITAIVILALLILFLLLSRSILVNHKVVEFLNVVVLLVVFEFINLLIHPFLESVTHHSPTLMLLALVAIAALIVPLHHKLEHWTSKKLVEKNKAIRLAKAKKTIAELEIEGI